MDGKQKLLRHLAYYLEILIIFILSGTPQLMPSILGIKPVLLLPVALTIAVFESEIPAMIYGCVCGVLLDVGFTGEIGYYTVVLTILSFVLGYCASNFFVTNFLNAMVIGISSVVALLLVHFFIFSICTGDPQAGTHFIRHYLIRIFYTLIFLPLFFWFNRLFITTMKD